MSLKQKVFDYLENHSETSLEQLIKAFSGQNRSTVRKYFYDFSKQSSSKSQSIAKPVKKTTGNKKGNAISTRQEVFDYMASHPDAEIDELCQAVTSAARKTIRDYRNKWLSSANKTSEVKPKEEPVGIQKKVFTYLNENPTANLNDLKKVFSNYKKLVTDFRSWKQKNAQSDDTSDLDQSQASSGSIPAESDKQKIRVLTTIIEKQRETIEKQKAKIKQISHQLSNLDRPGIKSIRKLVDRFLKR